MSDANALAAKIDGHSMREDPECAHHIHEFPVVNDPNLRLLVCCWCGGTDIKRLRDAQ